MDRKGIEKDKWAQTGWRIEQRYGNRVLIGSWAEERHQFTREPKIANSISRVDYRPHWDFKPDVFERRAALLRAEGLPYRILFDHHSSLPSHYLTEDYKQRYAHKPSGSLPAIQLWNPNMTFQSESFDKAISALSADSDPLKYTDDFCEKQRSQLPSTTVYRSSCRNHPLDALCKRRFVRAPRALSSHACVASRNNRDPNLTVEPVPTSSRSLFQARCDNKTGLAKRSVVEDLHHIVNFNTCGLEF